MMFEPLRSFDVVLVTGPQRSGTTIAARMIAADTGHTYVDETDYGVHDTASWRAIVRLGGWIIVHCPAMCHLVHEWAADPRVAVVLMRRALADIVASQERIGWTAREEAGELAKYGHTQGPIAQIKYDLWQRWQRDLFPARRRFEVEYESLSGHPLWVHKEQRAKFTARQTA